MKSRHGYAQIRPRTRPKMEGSAVTISQDMWAYRMNDIIASSNYRFDPLVYGSHCQIDVRANQPKNLTTRSQGRLGSRKKRKNQIIGPRTLNSKLVNSNSKVPIKHLDQIPPYHFPSRLVLISDSLPQQTTTLNTSISSGSNDSPGESGYGLSNSSSGAEQLVMSPGYEEDDLFSNDDYVDITSDSHDDDQSVDEDYKVITDRAICFSSGSYNS